MPTNWDAQRAADLGPGYYSREQSLEMHLAGKRRENEATAAQAAEAFGATAQGELAGLELEMVELAVRMPDAAWQAMWAEKGEAAPPKPQEKDLPLESRNRLLQTRMHQLVAERTKQLAAERTKENR